MWNFFRNLWRVQSKPSHLCASVLLAFSVMLFINGFVGSMGGMPVFIGFFTVYYVLRKSVLAGPFGDKELKWSFVLYACGYLLVYLVMLGVILASKVTGWGNVGDVSMMEYLDQIYGSTMLERWAYLFTGLFMYAYVISLFPLVTMRRWKSWWCYLVADVLIAAGVCEATTLICRIFIADEIERRAGCIMDSLLLCSLPQMWEAILYICAAFATVLVAGLCAYLWAKRCQKVHTSEVSSVPSQKIQFLTGCVLTVLGFVFLGGMTAAYVHRADSLPRYKKAAEYLTKDTKMGPMICGGSVYIPVNKELDYYETGRVIGYLADADEDCEGRLYRLTAKNYLYANEREHRRYLQYYGEEDVAYMLAQIVENQNAWAMDDVFLLWDEEWEAESSLGSSFTGYSHCEKDFVIALETAFGNVYYQSEDFADCDAYFTISGYKELKDALNATVPRGDWVGCILVKNNEFFYGNYDNPITGELLEKLLDVLGGNS